MSSTVVLTQTRIISHPNTKISQSITEANEESRETIEIVFDNCDGGLGIKIIGGYIGEDEKNYGIFIKRVLPGGLAADDGQIQEGDQLLKVNGDSLTNATNEEAVSVLRKASAENYISLFVARDDKSREEFLDVLDSHQYSSSSSVCSRDAFSSRATTPTVHGSRSFSGQNGSLSQSSSAFSPSVPPLPIREKRRGSGASSFVSDIEEPRCLASPAHNMPYNSDSPDMILNAGAASMQHKGLLMAPTMSSTPQNGAAGFSVANKQSSSLYDNTDSMGLQPSPGSQINDPSAISASGIYPGSTPEVSQDFNPGSGSNMSKNRKLSLDPHVRLRIEKLQLALKYLGLDPAPEQEQELEKRLHLDGSGTCTYGEFVAAARDIFKFQLEERNINPNALFFGTSAIKDFTDPPAFKPLLSSIPDMLDGDSYDEMKCQRDELRRELERVKLQLREKEKACQMAEDELLKIRRNAQGAIEESRSLRSKVHLAEQAQRAARNMEHDYEEVVRLLETEVAELKNQQTRQMDHPSVQKRLTVLGCQLRKTDNSKKTYEVATEKLIHFAELVHETMLEEGDIPLAPRPGSAKTEGQQGSKPPGYLTNKANQTLGGEARDVVRTVKSLLEDEPLPFGWEEAYTSDGMKYFINHVTQVTQWIHPLSNVQHSGVGLAAPPAPTHRQSPSEGMANKKATRHSPNGNMQRISPKAVNHRESPPTASKSSPRGNLSSHTYHERTHIEDS